MPPSAPHGAAPLRDDDNPGYTRAFSSAPFGEPSFGEPSFGEPSLEEAPSAEPRLAGPLTEPRTNVTTYRAGQAHPQVSSTPLAWRPLLAGLFRHPVLTFEQMRDKQVWGPALIVSAVYGALAVFGFGDTRNGVVNSAFSIAVTIILSSAVGIVLAGLMFGGVTHALARRFGGDGAWAPTIGFAMLITWSTDLPRLFFSFFLAADNGFVQVLGWASWLLCAGLLTTMVRQLHDLPWGKAAGAASLQLIAVLILIKLPTLG